MRRQIIGIVNADPSSSGCLLAENQYFKLLLFAFIRGGYVLGTLPVSGLKSFSQNFHFIVSAAFLVGLIVIRERNI
ncbi:MAG: hypothetical protein P8Y38_02675 [Deltaproteobacteria bacterium]